MDRTEVLKQKVNKLYAECPVEVKMWASWIYSAHVVKVVELTQTLAEKYNANKELAIAGALLHDVADAKMRREEQDHAEQSYNIAQKLLSETGFSQDEIDYVIEKVIKPHSCKKVMPETLEGKVLATADAIAHLTTDLYKELYELFPDGETEEEYNEWVYEKLKRDLYKKIQFEEERELYTKDYERLREVFKPKK